MGKSILNFKNVTSKARLVRILAALEIAPMTTQQLADETFSSVPTIQHYMRVLHKQRPKKVYVHSWEASRDGVQMTTPCWALGNRPDKKQPVPLTATQRTQRMRINMRRKSNE